MNGIETTIESFRRVKKLTALSTAQLAHETGITARAAAALLSGKVDAYTFPDDIDKRIQAAIILYHDYSTFAESDFSGRVVNDGPIVRPKRRDGSPMYSDPQKDKTSRDFSCSMNSTGMVIENAHKKTRVFKYVNGELAKVN